MLFWRPGRDESFEVSAAKIKWVRKIIPLFDLKFSGKGVILEDRWIYVGYFEGKEKTGISKHQRLRLDEFAFQNSRSKQKKNSVIYYKSDSSYLKTFVLISLEVSFC